MLHTACVAGQGPGVRGPQADVRPGRWILPSTGAT